MAFVVIRPTTLDGATEFKPMESAEIPNGLTWYSLWYDTTSGGMVVPPMRARRVHVQHVIPLFRFAERNGRVARSASK